MALIGSSNSEKIWNFLIAKIKNPFGVAGLMGNIGAESGFMSNNLQNTYEKSLGYTDDEYVAAVDSGRYTNFVHDSAGFGLVQWTYWSLKEYLLNYAKKNGKSIGDLEMQLECLCQQLQEQYKSVWNVLISATDILTASNKVLFDFERPADQGTAVQNKRASIGQECYNQFANKNYSSDTASTTTTTQTTTYSAERLIAIAIVEIGYHEKASNSQLDDKYANSGSANWTKYARDLAQAGYYNGNKNGYAWCDVFVDWCFYQLANKNAAKAQEIECQTGPLGAGCLYSMQYYKNAGRFYTTPQVGDQIFFSYSAGEISHTGIVETVSANQITTIEGNTSDCVARRTYARNNGSIVGYGRPKYNTAGSTVQPTSSTPSAPVSSGKPVLKYGSTGDYVKELQTGLKTLGYDIGYWGVDGQFGNDTKNAVIKFQTDKKITIDGIVGNETWNALTTALSSKSKIVTKGCIVSISSNAVYYSGKDIPAWVKKLNWYVLEVAGNRAVLGKSEDGKFNIVSPVNTQYLTVVR